MEKKQHPIENLMLTAMTSLENMIDVNTIVGDTVKSDDGTLIIPVSKVSFGFAAGGSEFNSNKLNKFSENGNLPFGGGSGAGVNISPMAFLVVKDGMVKLLTMDSTGHVDRLVEMIPNIIEKSEGFIKNICKDKNQNKFRKIGYSNENSKNEELKLDDFDEDK